MKISKVKKTKNKSLNKNNNKKKILCKKTINKEFKEVLNKEVFQKVKMFIKEFIIKEKTEITMSQVQNLIYQMKNKKNQILREKFQTNI